MVASSARAKSSFRKFWPKLIVAGASAYPREIDHPRFAEIALHFPANPGTRAFIHIAVSRVSSSCGFSVSFFDYREHRATLDDWAVKQGPEKMQEYRANKNQKSIDGLPAFDTPAS